MKLSTLSNRLDKRYTGSKSRVAYRTIKAIAEGRGTYEGVYNNLIRPTSSSKRGVVCYLSDFKELLDLLGVRYESGNDAPRCGVSGNFIKLTHLK